MLELCQVHHWMVWIWLWLEFEGVQTISFQILAAETVPYPDVWSKRLKTCNGLSAEEFLKLHNEYGNYLGDLCKGFIKKNNSEAEVIASHGHTIFHQPDNRFTFQLGSGACIAATTGVTTVSDFRSLDVALGGQKVHRWFRLATDSCLVNMIIVLPWRFWQYFFRKNG
ncbi:MAG: anhydro-N-acetylmuramic acid kinase [Bacteroidia bacterium]